MSASGNSGAVESALSRGVTDAREGVPSSCPAAAADPSTAFSGVPAAEAPSDASIAVPAAPSWRDPLGDNEEPLVLWVLFLPTGEPSYSTPFTPVRVCMYNLEPHVRRFFPKAHACCGKGDACFRRAATISLSPALCTDASM